MMFYSNLCRVLISICLYKLEFTLCGSNDSTHALLYEAINENKTGVHEWLLNHGEDINIRDYEGKTPLISFAGYQDSLKAIELLIREKANVNSADLEGRTALFEAARTGQVDTFEYLLDHEANYTHKDIRGRTVVHIASKHGQCKIIETLIEKLGTEIEILDTADDWGMTPYYYAALNGSLSCLKLLGKYNVSKEENVIVGGVNSGNLEVVIYLIDYVDKNFIKATNESGMSLLGIASDKKFIDIAKYLIDKGSDVNVTDTHDRNLLHITSEVGSVELVSVMMSNQVNANGIDDLGNTPLHYAAKNDDDTIIGLLLDGGARLDLRNNDNKSPAEVAAENNSLRALSVMFNRGQNINSIDSNGKTLAHISVLSGAVKSLKFLIGMGVDYNKTDKDGNQPLHFSVNNFESLTTLLEAGVDVDTLNSEGKTALELATDLVNMRAVKCLIKYGAHPEKVNRTLNPGDRYFAYVTNPTVPTKKDVFTFLTKVIYGEIEASSVEC